MGSRPKVVIYETSRRKTFSVDSFRRGRNFDRARERNKTRMRVIATSPSAAKHEYGHYLLSDRSRAQISAVHSQGATSC